jgi:hypothetical protein
MLVVERVFIKLSCRCGYLSVINILEYNRQYPITCARCGNKELMITGKTIIGADSTPRICQDKEEIDDRLKEWERKYDSLEKHI